MAHPIGPAPQANPTAFQIQYQTHNGAWHLGPVIAGDHARADCVCQEVRRHPAIAAALVVPAAATARKRRQRLHFPSAQALRRLAWLPLDVLGQHFHLPPARIARLLRQYGIGRQPGRRVSQAGYLVGSRYELLVGNWLHRAGINHRYDACIFGTRLRCDFELRPGPVYVEIWGMIGCPAYDRRRRVKRKLYRDHGVDLVELYPRDFAGQRWQEILSIAVARRARASESGGS